jgi:uncharacterized membrane protein YgcG
MKILILLVFLAISAHCANRTTWLPKDLAKSYQKSNNTVLFDPDYYLNDEALTQSTKNLTYELQTNKNFIVRTFIIYGIATDYSNFFSKNIEKFVDNLSMEILGNDKEKEKNSLFILFSIYDRQMRIRTGANVKAELSDSRALEILNSVKSNLRNYYYDYAINSVVKQIYTRITSPYTIYWDILEYVLIGVVVLVVILVSICSVNNKRISRPAAHRLDKIRQICLKNKPKREIIETTCVICLEEFEKNTQLQVKSKNNLEEELGHDPKSMAKIECGHAFHYGCISEWTRNHNTCPTCREKIDKEDDGRELSHDLVAVQTTLFPDISRAILIHGSGFSWRNNYSLGSTSGARSSSWNIGGGGASSSW